MTTVTRTFEEWKQEATYTRERQKVLELGIELRTNWMDWRKSSGYRTLDDCLRDTMKITASALQQRIDYQTKGPKKRKKERVKRGDGWRNKGVMANGRHVIKVQVTVCKLCPRGIYQGEEMKWSRNPMGLVHAECGGEG